LALLPPGAPTLAASTSMVSAGGSVTLTWSSLNASSCTASDDWSGTLPTSGSKTVSPSAVGTATYMLSCSNAVGSASTSVVLSVVAAAAPAHSGGGGGIDEVTLLALATFWLIRQQRRRQA